MEFRQYFIDKTRLYLCINLIETNKLPNYFIYK